MHQLCLLAEKINGGTWQQQALGLKNTGITWTRVYNVAIFHITPLPFSSSASLQLPCSPSWLPPSSRPLFAKHHTSVSCFPPPYLSSDGIGRSGKPSSLLFSSLQHFCPRAEVLQMSEGTLLICFSANSARTAEKQHFTKKKKNHQPLGGNKELEKLLC